MAKSKRCPNCGASNAESAEWCSLCLERFVADEPLTPAAAAAPKELGEAAHAGGSGPLQTATAPASVDTSAFEVTESGIKWICATCGTPNSLEEPVCSACGTTFAETVRPKPKRVQGDPGKAALFSLFFPGAGHAYLGMWGQAVARAVLSSWVLLVTIVGMLDREVPGSLAMAAMFGIVALGLWLLAAHDAFREATDEPDKVLLQGKRYLYLVLGLMVLLFIVMFLALMSARSRVQDDPVSGPTQAAGPTTSIPAWRSMSFPTSTELPTI